MKIFKNKGSKKKLKQVASSTYEVIDIVLENPRGILELAGSGIVGSSMQAQKVSRMIIMINKEHPGIPDKDMRNHMEQYDLMIWDYEDTNAIYIAGSMSNFYTMCVSNMSKHMSDSFTDYILKVLLEANYNCRDKYGASLFTDDQIKYFKSAYLAESVINTSIKHRKEMMDYIDPHNLILYDLRTIILDIDDTRKSSIMSMAKFSLVAKDKVIAYVNPRQLETIGILFENKEYEQEDDDMVATEVID